MSYLNQHLKKRGEEEGKEEGGGGRREGGGRGEVGGREGREEEHNKLKHVVWYTYQNNDNYRSNKGPDKLSVIPQPAPEEEKRGGRE